MYIDSSAKHQFTLRNYKHEASAAHGLHPVYIPAFAATQCI